MGAALVWLALGDLAAGAYTPPSNPKPLSRDYLISKGRMDASGRAIRPKVGTQQVFWMRVPNDTFGLIYQYAQKSATLQRIGVHCYLFVEDGAQVQDSVLDDLKTAYDANVYPTCRRYFGNEWNPGIDGDSLITILLSNHLQPGYCFSPFDEMPDSLAQKQKHHSNEREMMYLRSSYSPERIKGLMAHCQEHLIHWWQNPPGEAWLDEACAMYATDLCGYGPGGDLFLFGLNPTGSLTSWPSGIVDFPGPPDNGIFYAFMAYLNEKYPGTDPGDPLIRHLVARRDLGLGSIAPGIGTVEWALREVGYWPPIPFKNIYLPWTIANFLNDTTLGGPSKPYGYRKPLGGLPHFVATPPYGPPAWFTTLPESVYFTLSRYEQTCFYIPAGKEERRVEFAQDTFTYFYEGGPVHTFAYQLYLATSTTDSFVPGTITLQALPTDSTLLLSSNSSIKGAKIIICIPYLPWTGDIPRCEVFAYAPLSPAETSAVKKPVYVFPNPFNPDQEKTHFRYVVTQSSKVDIRIYDVAGNQLAVIAEKQQVAPGIYNSQTWDGKNYRGKPVANGVYFGRVQIGSKSYGVKIAVMR